MESSTPSSSVSLSGRSAQTWSHFLRRVQAQGGLARDLAERAAVSVMCALEQRLFGGESEQLEAQLPVRLRELLRRCEAHQGRTPQPFGREQFLAMICEDLSVEVDEAEQLAHVIFETVREWITDGEVEDVAAQLPGDLRTLWAPTA
jgi:uncharacterized protein (DUF2267 family)